VVEPKGSTLLLSKASDGLNPEPVPSRQDEKLFFFNAKKKIPKFFSNSQMLKF
jgi:hypothetical protein